MKKMLSVTLVSLLAVSLLSAASVLASALSGLTVVAAAPAKRCLPPGVSDVDLASWPAVARQTMFSDGENGEPVAVSVVMYQTRGGSVVLASAGDVFIFFDPRPDDPNVPGLMNEQMFNPDRLLRSAPRGPCKWRAVKGGQTA